MLIAMIFTAVALGLVLPLLTGPVWAELCQDADGVFRTCSGTPMEDAPVSDHWKPEGATAEEKATARQQYQDLQEAEWQDRQDAIAEEYEQRRQAIEDRYEHLRSDQQQRRIKSELKWNSDLSRKSPVEQRYYFRQQGYDEEDVDQAYGR